jgi:hypothetical protein
MTTATRTPQVGEIYESFNANPFLRGNTVLRIEAVKDGYVLYSFKQADGTFSTYRPHCDTESVESFLSRYHLQPVVTA